MPPKTTDLKTRLENNSIKTANGCILWQKSRTKKGHGKIKLPGNRFSTAHRVAWQVFRGEIPANMCVCHRCDVPHCINPDHLFIGTVLDNNADMFAKNRQARGEGNGQSKLSERQVLEIKSSLANGEKVGALARKYGVAQATISSIASGKTWFHVDHLKESTHE